MNLIFIGDIVGKGGRSCVQKLLPDLKREFNARFVIANGENCAAGAGLTGKCVEELVDAGADVVTGGDHTWDQRGFEYEADKCDNFIRPANYSKLQPGRGYGIFRNADGEELAVVSLQGHVFMKESAYSPFETAERILKELPSDIKCIFVDFHAEATSEKIAMGHFLDGKVTAVIGTHTHVQTADARILPGGTAALTDVGMVGADFSVLGREVNDVLNKFHTGMPVKLKVVEEGSMRLDFAVVSCDCRTGKATEIKSYSRYMEIL